MVNRIRATACQVKEFMSISKNKPALQWLFQTHLQAPQDAEQYL